MKRVFWVTIEGEFPERVSSDDVEMSVKFNLWQLTTPGHHAEVKVEEIGREQKGGGPDLHGGA